MFFIVYNVSPTGTDIIEKTLLPNRQKSFFMVAGVGLEPHDLRVSHKASPCLPLRNIVALLA